ncbi:helix-turn-helix domain-containing protein [Mesorhizobium sp. PAMC28654]|nr:helix-turn-helix domain-containing protein [Mesorhizobium sp. PAMC28654]UDL92559.1 helix-turn-helix domain-containing protein [Mesorhizobium sp. PAMC28654]
MRKRATRDETELDGEGTQLSSSLVRGLGILRAFRPGDVSLGNQDIIARTGLPKATVSRITYTLSALGYLLYDKDLGRYSLGPATVALGYSALSSSAVVHLARPLMQPLADLTGAAVAIGTRDGLNGLSGQLPLREPCHAAAQSGLVPTYMEDLDGAGLHGRTLGRGARQPRTGAARSGTRQGGNDHGGDR